MIWATVPDRDLALYLGQTNKTLQNIVIIGAKIPEDLRTTWLCISPVAMHARKEQSISIYEFARSVPSYYSMRSGCALLSFENHTRNTQWITSKITERCARRREARDKRYICKEQSRKIYTCDLTHTRVSHTSSMRVTRQSIACTRALHIAATPEQTVHLYNTPPIQMVMHIQK